MNVKPKLPDYVKVIDATPEPVKGNTTRSYGYSIVHNTPVDVMMWMDETRLVVVYNIHMKVWDIASGVLLDHGKCFEFVTSTQSDVNNHSPHRKLICGATRTTATNLQRICCGGTEAYVHSN